MIIKRNYFYIIILSLFSYFFSMYISENYISAPFSDDNYFKDQQIYIVIWNLIKNKNTFEAYAIYRSNFASQEIFHFFYIHFLGLVGFTKNQAMSIANFSIVFFLLCIINKHFKPSILILMLIITNSYIFSYFFILERFKFAILFLILLIYFYENRKLRFIFFTLSVLSHFSILILYTVIYVSKFRDKNFFLGFNFKYKKKILNNNYFFLLLSLIFIFIFYDHLVIKSYQLFHDNTLLSLINSFKILTFLGLTFFVSQKDKIEELIIQFMLLFFAAYIIEPSRIVAFAYFLFIYHFLQNYRNKKNFLLFFFITLYFSFKTFYMFVILL
jgi:hypothetical protein